MDDPVRETGAAASPTGSADGYAAWLPLPLQIGMATFGILALELALIRWTSGQIRIMAYFNNLVLIGAFLGMGLGVALGRRRPNLVHWVLPVLTLLALPLAFSEELGIQQLSFSDSSVFLWGAEGNWRGAGQYALNLVKFAAIFFLVVLVFVLAGAPVGWLFPRIPTLQAYASDLLGSLAGVLAFTLITFFDASPPVWLALGMLPFLALSRRWHNGLAFVATALLGFYSVKGAVFSPYNRIDMQSSPFGVKLLVNRDFHQYLHDLSDRAVRAEEQSGAVPRTLDALRRAYDIPFQINPLRRRALVVGSGTGNDAQAALRNGYDEVDCVDIDGRIVALGRRLHPEHPYDSPRVKLIVNDARAFFEQYRGPAYDVVCYGLLDSHAMFSSMSSLRLDNYVYTEEGIRAAWRHVAPDGHLAVSFSVYAGPWISDRLYWTVAKATGREPMAVYHGMNHGATYVVAPDMKRMDRGCLERFQRIRPVQDVESVRTTADDWPFLYIRPGVFPLGYAAVLGIVLAGAFIATPLAFGRKSLGADFDPCLFFMGAAFMLIETRGVTSLSLLFGSTWLVNSAIFAGILAMVLAANGLVVRLRIRDLRGWYILLLLAVGFLWWFEVGWLGRYSLPTRGVLGGLINGLPIGLAGVIVSTLLARSRNPSAALGSNLLGSVVGGCLEYLSMVVGLKALVVLALVLYLASLLFYTRRDGMERRPDAPVRKPADRESRPVPRSEDAGRLSAAAGP